MGYFLLFPLFFFLNLVYAAVAALFVSTIPCLLFLLLPDFVCHISAHSIWSLCCLLPVFNVPIEISKASIHNHTYLINTIDLYKSIVINRRFSLFNKNLLHQHSTRFHSNIFQTKRCKSNKDILLDLNFFFIWLIWLI